MRTRSFHCKCIRRKKSPVNWEVNQRPKLVEPRGELLLRNDLFEVQKWNLAAPRKISSKGQFAIVCCLSGAIRCGDADLLPGGCFLVPASLSDQPLQPQREETNLLRISIPT